jgi:hypothetical protein
MACSSTTGRAVASYTYRFTGILMGTPKFTIDATHATSVKVTTTLTRPTVMTLRVTIVAQGKGSDTIQSVKISYVTC